MLPLATDLRKLLENKVPLVRTVAEAAARAALSALAVDKTEPYATLSAAQRRLRNALRARARQLGNGNQSDGFKPLAEEIAYEQWHRMVFARFLAENHLLMHPSGVPVSLAECAELAAEEGEPDAWGVAARYASAMLPGIFRVDDPSVQVRFAPEGRIQLEAILNELPASVFHADDSLGWMYQFWQKNKKEEVNASERKIGGADLAPVTQLFTEDYMVRFLLENSLGAWWAARHPESPLVKKWEYLRFKEDGSPAAGTFPGWPERAAEVTLMDPCCGSGHFLVSGFEMLAEMRMEEEGLNPAQAGEAVLRDNIFGLELDLRCTQIAAFALALAAWKRGGYRVLPVPNIACSGIPVEGQLDTWLKLAGEDARLKAGLKRLHEVFSDAPDLGSLINPAELPEADRMFIADYEQVAPVLEKALAKERAAEDPVAALFGAAAEGVAKAARLLAGRYTLVATNVPYLTRGKQSETLKEYCGSLHPNAKSDLATCFVERCCDLLMPSGIAAIVVPQNGLSQTSYKKYRLELLQSFTWVSVVWLGPGAFSTISGEVVKPALLILQSSMPTNDHAVWGLDCSDAKPDISKAAVLRNGPLLSSLQATQRANPDARLSFGSGQDLPLLSDFAVSLQGISPADLPHYGRCFWEVILSSEWHLWQGTPDTTTFYDGRSMVLWWGRDLQDAVERGSAYVRGDMGWGKRGVAVRQMQNLPCTIFTGEKFDTNVAAIIPKRVEHLAAIWAFCSSAEYARAVRQVDKKMNVTNATLVKVPFDLEHWQKVAEEAGPLPEPHSDDPTQWLFKGHPEGSTEPLQVAIARLLGYRWPQQEADALVGLGDPDGIVCLPAVYGEAPAAERLRTLLAAAYDKEWSPALQDRLLTNVGYGGRDLAEWLRDGFFTQHARLFHNRPFIWHIWDGRKDGFSALVNYHRLDAALLDKLIYTYLGSWITDLRKKQEAGEAGAEGRLVAALELQKKLELIRAGEPPYDIYVRWKTRAEQPIGWNPDLNDGVRLNIRPFVTAGVLRSRFTINWNKDRGKNLDGSERLNDLHPSIRERRAARGS